MREKGEILGGRGHNTDRSMGKNGEKVSVKYENGKKKKDAKAARKKPKKGTHKMRCRPLPEEAI